MTLLEELKERWSAIFLERESVEKRADELAEDMQELEVALAALQSLHNPIADEQPELFDEPQEIEASSQSESCVPALGAETDLPTLPGGAEESRDQLCSVEGCEIHADDASEFAEEGYAPVVEAEPSALTTWGQHEELRAAGFVPVGAPDDDGPVKWERRDHSEEGYAPVTQDEREQPVTDVAALIASGEHSYDEVAAIAYPEEPTKPEADSIAKALDHYDPKAVAERNRFDPFRMFRRETEDA